MRNQFFKSQILLTLALGVAVTSCSKKQKQDGDVAGDTAVQTTDLPGQGAGPGAGQRIPELNTVFFGFDSFALSADGKAILDANAAWLKANGARRVQVEGHCDERGTVEYNLALGERRANVVKDYLVSHGVDAAQLSTISYGEERAMDPGHGESAWAKNRRAEFVSGQ